MTMTMSITTSIITVYDYDKLKEYKPFMVIYNNGFGFI